MNAVQKRRDVLLGVLGHGNNVPPNHVIREFTATRSGAGNAERSDKPVECSEFLSRFSEFYDAPPEAPFRQQVEAHLAECEKCARYERAMTSGAALLQTLPRIQLSESFRPTLEHRLFHLEDENTLVRAAGASAVPALTAVGMAIVLAIVAWSPTLGRATAEVELAPIVVSGPPSPEPAFFAGTSWVTSQEPALVLREGLWSDPNALLYQYSPMRERYQTENFLRRTGF